MEDELKRNLATGNLRGALYNPEALKRLSALFQYNIELLGATTSAEDAEKASRSDTPSWEKCCLLARIAYRESLLMWQRAVGLKARDASFEFDESDIPSLGKGCVKFVDVNYPEMKCGKCKSVGKDVQYCCRGHQVMGWKEHKSTCGK
jgi:hypothetical protein